MRLRCLVFPAHFAGTPEVGGAGFHANYAAVLGVALQKSSLESARGAIARFESINEWLDVWRDAGKGKIAAEPTSQNEPRTTKQETPGHHMILAGTAGDAYHSPRGETPNSKRRWRWR